MTRKPNPMLNKADSTKRRVYTIAQVWAGADCSVDSIVDRVLLLAGWVGFAVNWVLWFLCLI